MSLLGEPTASFEIAGDRLRSTTQGFLDGRYYFDLNFGNSALEYLYPKASVYDLLLEKEYKFTTSSIMLKESRIDYAVILNLSNILLSIPNQNSNTYKSDVVFVVLDFDKRTIEPVKKLDDPFDLPSIPRFYGKQLIAYNAKEYSFYRVDLVDYSLHLVRKLKFPSRHYKSCWDYYYDNKFWSLEYRMKLIESVFCHDLETEKTSELKIPIPAELEVISSLQCSYQRRRYINDKCYLPVDAGTLDVNSYLQLHTEFVLLVLDLRLARWKRVQLWQRILNVSFSYQAGTDEEFEAVMTVPTTNEIGKKRKRTFFRFPLRKPDQLRRMALIAARPLIPAFVLERHANEF